jgi:superfamily I DNA/RNA helicase
MTDFTPTPEQAAIVEFATQRIENLVVEARAGAAKTSTLVLLAQALPDTKILCLAFNKAIAEEMKQRLPQNCDSKTLHGLGFGVWQRFTGKRTKVDGRKDYFLLSRLIKGLEDPAERDEAFELMAETLDILRTAKQLGWLPERFKGHWKPLVGDEDFFSALPMEPTALQVELVRKVAEQSFRLSLEGEIDFDDMIFCPALCQVNWPVYPLTLVDESQDLSAINHHCLKKLVRRNRLIAVGDPCQAIYGFRGADTRSMENLRLKFDCEVLYLTVSFRCARLITENAQWRAPDMQAPDWAAEGQVRRHETWSATDLKPGDAIICRNNAPLFSLAIKLIEHDQLPRIAGRDIGAPLVKLMKKLGKAQMLTPAALDALASWEEKELKRARDGARGSIRDKAQVIRIMLSRTKTLGDAIAYLEHLLQRDGRIDLMTGHKSKGLEFDRVWFLDQHLCNLDHEQDANIKYVIETRAKKELHYVSTSGLVEE